MSTTASNYNVSFLYTGIAIALFIDLVNLITNFGLFVKAGSSGVWTFFAIIAYGVVMFASSFIEEEQHFWYWTTSAWISWLAIKQYFYLNLDATSD